VVRTLTAQMGDIMTTDAQYTFLQDISQPNSVLRVMIDGSPPISAAVWTIHRRVPIMEARLECLRYVLTLIEQRYPLCQFWIIVGHKAIQPDNRISRHNRIWVALKNRGIPLPPGNSFEDVSVAAHGLRFFGAAHFDLGHLDWAHRIMIAEVAAIVITQQRDNAEVIKELVHEGWSLQNTKPPTELLNACRRHPVIIVDVYGEFDDPDVAVSAMGTHDVVKCLKYPP
jgi:hypothetical protein